MVLKYFQSAPSFYLVCCKINNYAVVLYRNWIFPFGGINLVDSLSFALCQGVSFHKNHKFPAHTNAFRNPSS